MTSSFRGKTYYHLKYTLTKHNILSIKEVSKSQFSINGGQFDVLIGKEDFPVNAPKCNSNIILRMPWTTPENTHFDRLVSEKYKVHQSIVNVLNSKENEELAVYIELNPYVEVSGNRLQLTQCNVFFRHAGGQYISKVGEVSL